nr:hypothetical protein [Tanacetum cinerariifolium]
SRAGGPRGASGSGGAGGSGGTGGNADGAGMDIDGYTNRFHELALLCPRMVESEAVKVEQYIRGLAKSIRGDVTSSQPATINDVEIAGSAQSVENWATELNSAGLLKRAAITAMRRVTERGIALSWVEMDKEEIIV